MSSGVVYVFHSRRRQVDLQSIRNHSTKKSLKRIIPFVPDHWFARRSLAVVSWSLLRAFLVARGPERHGVWNYSAIAVDRTDQVSIRPIRGRVEQLSAVALNLQIKINSPRPTAGLGNNAMCMRVSESNWIHKQTNVIRHKCTLEATVVWYCTKRKVLTNRTSLTVCSMYFLSMSSFFESCCSFVRVFEMFRIDSSRSIFFLFFTSCSSLEEDHLFGG